MSGRNRDGSGDCHVAVEPDADAIPSTRGPASFLRRQPSRLKWLFGKTRWSGLAGVLAASALAISIGAVGITDEAYVSLQGDMPRYLMNGVYFHDLAVDRPFGSVSQLIEYTQLYYARYPALSLGHHPPLLPMVEAPIFGLLGVSTASARLVILLFFVVAVAFLYLLVSDICGPLAGLFAAAFFATSPSVVIAARSVLSETPALALVIVTAYCFHRFLATGHWSLLMAFVIASSLSLYAKQLAIFVFPAFLGTAWVSLGLRRLLKRDMLIAFSAIAALALPLVPMTLALSQSNVSWSIRSAGRVARAPYRILLTAFEGQFEMPVLLLALAGAGLALWKRDQRLLLFLLWIAGVLFGLLFFGRIDPARYSVYWVPALCALAASVTTAWRRRLVSVAVCVAALFALSLQASASVPHDLVRAEGYEEGAQFVLQMNPGPTVLFSGDVDTGFFAFFVRKHDPERRLVVLRSDKILTTSLLARVSIGDRISEPREIYDLLNRFGVKFVVIEDRPSQSMVLEWLRQELRSSQFIERRRIPFKTSDRRLRGTSLVVYEYTKASAPAEHAVLSMNLPLVRRSVTVPLTDLIDRKYLR